MRSRRRGRSGGLDLERIPSSGGGSAHALDVQRLLCAAAMWRAKRSRPGARAHVARVMIHDRRPRSARAPRSHSCPAAARTTAQRARRPTSSCGGPRTARPARGDPRARERPAAPEPAQSIPAAAVHWRSSGRPRATAIALVARQRSRCRGARAARARRAARASATRPRGGRKSPPSRRRSTSPARGTCTSPARFARVVHRVEHRALRGRGDELAESVSPPRGAPSPDRPGRAQPADHAALSPGRNPAGSGSPRATRPGSTHSAAARATSPRPGARDRQVHAARAEALRAEAVGDAVRDRRSSAARSRAAAPGSSAPSEAEPEAVPARWPRRSLLRWRETSSTSSARRRPASPGRAEPRLVAELHAEPLPRIAIRSFRPA